MTDATLTSLPVAAEPTAAEPVKKDRVKKKKDRVRSAWISFVGRILAQVIGAAATITLGLMFVQKHQANSGAADAERKKAAAVALSAIVADDRSVAVLPMQNFSRDRSEDYFADGMTEALIASLAQMPNLRVISRTSSMSYKQTQRPLREIASELGVRWIVEGSIVGREGRVRITAQLIDAKNDEHLWARTYDRGLDDVLAIQAEIATAIARDVRGALGSSGDE